MPESAFVSGAVHTRSESPWDGLRDMQTCGMTLASAYMLHCLPAIWSQFQKIGRSPRWEWALIWYVAVEHWGLNSIRALSLSIIRLANYSVTTSLIYKFIL